LGREEANLGTPEGDSGSRVGIQKIDQLRSLRGGGAGKREGSNERSFAL
jgi:hypothetical protein